MGHLRQHIFTGNTDHDFNGLNNNYLPKLNSSGTGITDSQIFDDSSSVGINQPSPAAKLDIKGSGSDTSYSLKLKSSANTETTSIRNDGYTELNKLGIGVIMGDQTTNYLQHIQNRLEQFSNSASYTGFHANRNGTGISLRSASANNISLVESTGTMTFSTNWDNNFNNIGTLAMLINGDNQYVGIGMPTNLTIPGAKLNVRGSGTTGDGSAFLVEDSAGTDLLHVSNDGHIGINALPVSGDRFKITAGSGLDGAINISASNLANNGYALLAQGSSSSSSYNGIWSDAQGASTNNRAFQGSALAQAVTNNYGGYFLARNGSGQTVGVYGLATGGDSVEAADSVGVLGVNSSEVSTNKKGVWGYLNSNVNNGTGYGGKFEAGGAGTNAVNYAVHGLANGNAASVTNYAGYFQANGGSGAANYAIVTNGGTSGFGSTAPTDMVHINGSTGSTQLRLEQSHTPTSSGSTSGNIGSVAWDDNYFYVKTNLGWGRVAFDYNF